MKPALQDTARIPKERIAELEILRALSFLAVVLQHTLGVYIREAGIPISQSSMLGMLFNLNKFAVPAFVFITGLTLFYNYYEQVNYRRFLQKRAAEILVPYLAWTLIYLWVANQYRLPDFSLHWAIEFAKNILLGGQYYHLWFIPMLFQFYLLYPVLLKLFKRAQTFTQSRAGFWIIIGSFSLFYGWLMWFTVSYIGGGHLRTDNWLLTVLIRYLDRNFLFWSFYFLLGAIAGAALSQWRQFVIRSVQWNSFLFISLFLWVGYELMRSVLRGGLVDLNYSTSLKPSMFLYTVSEILLLYGLSMLLAASNTFWTRLLRFFARYSYGAFLAHAWVLNIFLRIAEKFHVWEGISQNSIIKSAIAFSVVSVLSVMLTYIVSQLPFGHLVMGASGKKKTRDPEQTARVAM